MEAPSWNFLLYAVPLSVIAGGAYAIVTQAFRIVWRIAQLEKNDEAKDARLVKVEEACDCIHRIEATLQQWTEDRRSAPRGRTRNDTSGGIL